MLMLHDEIMTFPCIVADTAKLDFGWSGKKRKARTMFIAMEMHTAKKVAAAIRVLTKENFELKLELKHPFHLNTGQLGRSIDESKDGAQNIDAYAKCSY